MAVRPGSAVGVSVVTVALNAADALPLTLESVIAQDHPDLEIVVVDGMSWDASGEVLRRYAPALDRVVTAEDAGIYYAMNQALAHVSKDYVLFMNAGDRFYRADAVSRMVGALEDDPDIFYGNHVYVGAGLELFKRSAPFDWLAQRLAEGRIDGAWIDRIPGHQATFARADLLRRLGFDTRLRIGADHELLFRAHAEGARMQYVDEIVCHYAAGGFSAAAGARTTLEGASIYRRFSDRPDLVDRLFYPAGSPFAPQTRRSGMVLGGLFPGEGWAAGADRSQGGDWIAGDGAQLLSPSWEAGGLELAGYNELHDQRVSFLAGDEVIGEADVPREFFRLEIAFRRPAPAGTIVRMVPSRAHLFGARQHARVGFAIRFFRFADAKASFPPGLPPGKEIAFEQGTRDEILPLLGFGWSAPDPTQLWSLGARSELWLKLAPSAVALRLAVGGNPHVPDGRQRLQALVNGDLAAELDINQGYRGTLEIDCTQWPWRQGEINRLTLVPTACARPPEGTGDTRLIGFGLWHIAIV